MATTFGLSTESAPKPSRGKLVYSLLAVMALMALAPLAFTAWRLVAVNRESLEVNWKEYQMLAASTLSSEATHTFHRVESSLEQVGLAFEWSGAESVRATLERMARTRFLQNFLGGDIAHLRISDATGGYYVDETLFAEVGDDLNRELLAAFRAASEGQTYVGTPFFFDGDSAPSLVMGYPLMVQGQRVGTLAAVVDLASIRDAAMQSARTSGFSLYLIDSEGRAFIRAKPAGEAASVSRDHALLSAAHAAMKRSPNTPASQTFAFDRIGENLKRVPMVGSFITLPRPGWAILIEIEQARAYAAIFDMRQNAIYISLGAFAVAVVASAAFARYLTSPLKSLTEAAERLSEGDFSKRAEVSSRNELGVLADAFNKMAGDMQNYIARLQRMSEENRKMFMGSIRVLSAAIDAKDPYTRGHSERVAHYSVAVAKHMGMSEEQLDRVRIGALLHDVGKIGIADAILGKPSPLTDEEFEIMKQHPEKGARIMAQIEPLRDVVPAIRYHHERFSGGGYPTGVAGENIPLLGRIVAVADTFDAMTTERPYQKAMTFDYACAKIYELRESKYDPKVVDALIKAYRAGDIRAGLRGPVLADDGAGDAPPKVAAKA